MWRASKRAHMMQIMQIALALLARPFCLAGYGWAILSGFLDRTVRYGAVHCALRQIYANLHRVCNQVILARRVGRERSKHFCDLWHEFGVLNTKKISHAGFCFKRNANCSYTFTYFVLLVSIIIYIYKWSNIISNNVVITVTLHFVYSNKQ